MKQLGILLLLAGPALAGPIVTLTNTATTLAQNLVGAGVTLSGTPTLTETGPQSGTFSGGQTNLIGFSSGIILSSGNAADASGVYAGVDLPSTSEGGPGNAMLSNLIGGTPTFDAAVLSFNFIPNASTVFFQYTFASAEYPVFVNSAFNDVFGFFVNGVNFALIPGTSTQVSINSVNAGTNSAFFNKYNAAGDTLPYGGETVVLTFTAPVNANVVNSITLGIADASDSILDSAVFIQAGSITTTPTPEPATFGLIGSALIGLGVFGRRLKKT
jgi:hypothetical protein